MLFNLWDGIRTSADTKSCRVDHKHCADENRQKLSVSETFEKARCVSLNQEPTVHAKNPGGDDTLNEHERERGNSAVKSFHLKVPKASLQRFISRDNAMERNGGV